MVGTSMEGAAGPLLGRDPVLAAAAEVLAAGRSLLLVSRAGDGLTAVARTVAGRSSADGATIVTGLAGLTEMPLAALVVAGVIPPARGGDDAASRMRMGLRSLEISAARNGPRPLLVEGIGHLDDLTVSLLVRAVMDQTVQLVAAVPLGAELRHLHPLLSSGAMRSCTVPPLSDGVLRRLAPDDADAADVERALAVADGSPLWFLASLAAGWVDEGPLPPAMCDLADWHLSRLDDQVRRVLEMVALAGAVPGDVLATASSPQAVATARDGAFLRVDGVQMLVRSPIHRARLLEHASLRRGALTAELRHAAATTGRAVPLLDTADRPLHPATANAMVGAAPRAVLDALARTDAPLDAALVLARGRARLETFDVPGAISDFSSLLQPGVDPAVRADAAMGLSILQAHMLGDLHAARATIARTAADIADPALAQKVRARQVVIEVYGYGMPEIAEQIPDPSTIPRDDPDARLAVLKANGILHAGKVGELDARHQTELVDLLGQTAATAAERWEALVPFMWRSMFRGGFAPAVQIVETEMERARARGDLTAIAAWLHSLASALTLGGHLVPALQTIRRGLAALATIDRYGLSPQLQLLELRCLAHLQGPIPDLDRIDDLVAVSNGYEASFRAGVAAEISAVRGDQHTARELLHQCQDHATRIGWPLVGWSMVLTSVAQDAVELPAQLAEEGSTDRFLRLTSTVRDGDHADAITALRDLAAMGWPAAAAALGRRRSWATATSPQQLEAQHVLATCQDIAAPALGAAPGPASSRQLVVAQHAAAGASDGDIAAQLNLSRRTVSNHLSRLYDAAGLDGRQDLAQVLTPVGVWQP